LGGFPSTEWTSPIGPNADKLFKYSNSIAGGFLEDYPLIDSDAAWMGRSMLGAPYDWHDIGNGKYGYVYAKHMHGLRAADIKVMPVIVNPGDYIVITIEGEEAGWHSGDAPGYGLGFQTGSLVPHVTIGASRCGVASAGDYSAGFVSNGVHVIDQTHLLVRIPHGAKSGPLRIMGRKAATSWVGKKIEIATGVLVNKGIGDYLIPIIVMCEAQPICEEAYQCGRTNVDSIESMTNPFGAETNAGDTVQIGSNVFTGSRNLPLSAFTKAGSAWPYGFTAQQMHFMNAYAKEMTFRVAMATNAGHYGPAIGSLILMAVAASITPLTAVFAMTAAAGAISVYGGLIMHELSRASGGSTFFRMHRMYNHNVNDQYRNAAPADVSQARDGQFGHVTFSKVMETSQGANVSAMFYMDFSRTRVVTDNKLHDSVARTNNTVSIGGIKSEGSAYLNCEGGISVLNPDGTENRKMIVAKNQNNPNIADCSHDKGDGKWYMGGAESTYMRNTTGRVHTAADPHIFEQTNVHRVGAEWEYPHGSVLSSSPAASPGLDWTNGNRVTPRFWGGMTPMTSPPGMRNISYENQIQNSIRRMGDDHDHWDLTRSEGLAYGGSLFFPLIFAQAIGKGHMPIASSRIYTESFKCLKCSATDYGKDARYCMRNKNALGFGGWFFGEKAKPSFHLGGKPLRRSVKSFETASILNIIPYSNTSRPELARYFSKEDRNMHDRSKYVAGKQYGGWPENILSASASYQRQAGSSCFIEEPYVDASIDPNHPNAKPAGDPLIGEVNPNDHDIHGHGFEHWDAGCIPTFVKNEVSAWDIFHFNINKYNNMRSDAALKLTERNDLIHIVGTMDPKCWILGKYDKIETVGPQHEFYSGDIVVIRISPNTTRTSAPSRSCRLRDINDDYVPFFGAGAGGKVDFGGVGFAANATPNQFNYFTIGSRLHLEGPASLIMKARAGMMLDEGDFYDKTGMKGLLGTSAQCQMSFGKLDNVLAPSMAPAIRKARKTAIGVHLGPPIDTELLVISDEYIDGWNQMLKVQSRRKSQITYTPSFFKNLRKVTYGRNGPECQFFINNKQADGRWTQNAGGRSGSQVGTKWDAQDVKDLEGNGSVKVCGSNNCGIAVLRSKLTIAEAKLAGPPPDDDWQAQVNFLTLELGRQEGRLAIMKTQIKNAGVAPLIAAAGTTHLQEQQIAIKLPFAIQSGNGPSMGIDSGDTDRQLTNEYLWLYFEEALYAKTEGIPWDVPKSDGTIYSAWPSSSYIGLCLPINIYNPNKINMDNRNSLSKEWGVPLDSVTASRAPCRLAKC
jgi:hypothetical protein